MRSPVPMSRLLFVSFPSKHFHIEPPPQPLPISQLWKTLYSMLLVHSALYCVLTSTLVFPFTVRLLCPSVVPVKCNRLACYLRMLSCSLLSRSSSLQWNTLLLSSMKDSCHLALEESLSTVLSTALVDGLFSGLFCKG